MGTPLKSATTIGSKIASVLVVSVSVRADGAIHADWQGLDANEAGVIRQVAAFAPDAAKPLLAAPASELVARAEAAIVQAITAGGEAPPQSIANPRPALPPSVASALAGARAKRLANVPPTKAEILAATVPASEEPAPALPASHPYAAAASRRYVPPPAAAPTPEPSPQTAVDDMNRARTDALAALVAETMPAAELAPPEAPVYPEGHPYAPKAPPAALPSTSAPTEPPPDASAEAEVPADPPTTPIYPKGHPYAPKP